VSSSSGFLAATLSALFLGELADKRGRRQTCLVFCGTYAVNCLTKISNNAIVLFIGGSLGGLSTALIYSVFKSSMGAEYYAQHLEKSNMSLSAMFGIMTIINSIVSIISGVLRESLVGATGMKVNPFIATIVLLALAF
jgi:MFS transporter, MFS domain-containing protein family, molybdate-anion transporter